MKKTLAAVAVLGAFAGSALAAEVQLYGIVDMGVQYMHSDLDVQQGPNAATYDATDKFEMKSGMQSGSRWGFKGTEDLGNGLTVGFILEDGFDADDGTEDSSNVMFNRESSLFIEGGFGKLALGRIGSFNGGVSSWAKYGVMSAFGTSWGDYSAQAGNWAIGGGMWDNMIAYETPDFAGFKVFAQYGMGNSVGDDSVENESTSDRYYALGASYANGPLNLYLAVDSINYATAGADGNANADDSLTVTFGGNYDFEVVKLFGGAQYFDEVRLSSLNGAVEDYFKAASATFDDASADLIKIKGWSLGLSGSIPAAGGNVLVGAAYVDAETADSMEGSNIDINRWIVSAGYDYPLSKRTNVYGVVTYNQDSIDWNGFNNNPDEDPTVFGVMIGMRHKF